MWARVAGAVVGMWLFLSAFAWPHGWAQFTNAWVTGMLCTTFAVSAMTYPGLRYVMSVLAVWLFVSSLYLLTPVSMATMWNNALIAVALLILSLIPNAQELGASGEEAGELL